MQRSLAHELQRVLSERDLETLHLVAHEAASLGQALYVVGGLPRDLLLGRPPTDLDLVVEGSSIELARSLALKYGGKVTAHPKFGTAQWQRAADTAVRTPSTQGPQIVAGLDLITARSETYPKPAQLPHVRPGTIEDDLRRRDFTINTLAIRLDERQFGELLDPLGGFHDLEAGKIRVLHDQSFRDDPTRMYRAVRYEHRLGFKITPETRRLIPGAIKWIDQLSAHRLRQELQLMLGEKDAAEMVLQLDRLDLLSPIDPALPCDEAVIRRLRIELQVDGDQAAVADGRQGPARRWLMWLMGLQPSQIRSVRKRLHFDRRLTEELLAAAELQKSVSRLSRLRPSKLTERLQGFPLPAVEAVERALPPGRPKHQLREYLTNWRHVRPHTTGHMLKEMGIPTGPAYRVVLQGLRNGWIDGTIRNVEQEKAHLAKSLGRILAAEHRKRGSPAKRRLR